MKKREGNKGRKPTITDKKKRGEWAEMIFMARAAELGIAVNKPWGDTRSWDFVVGRPGRFVAVQVKSTVFEIQEGSGDAGYLCTVCSSGRPYPPGSFDVLAAYVIDENAWYIVPEEKIRGMKSISLSTHCAEARYESYREAWHLLQDISGGEPIDLQACAEEFPAAWD